METLSEASDTTSSLNYIEPQQTNNSRPKNTSFKELSD